MTIVDVYEQDCHGRTQYRVMRRDGLLVFGVHQLDCGSQDEAVALIRGEFRRNRLGAFEIHSHRRETIGGRREIVVVLRYDEDANVFETALSLRDAG